MCIRDRREGEEVVRGGDEQVVVHGAMVEHEAHVPHRAEAVLIGIGAVIEHIQFKARVARGGLLRPGGKLTGEAAVGDDIDGVDLADGGHLVHEVVQHDLCLLYTSETHNHPTEIEPFGGAATCIGGAIRDPLAGRGYVYQAMRVTGAADPRTPLSETLPGKLPQIGRASCRERV